MARRRVIKAICPICKGMHQIMGHYWIIPSKPDTDTNGTLYQWDGVQSEFWCDVENVGVVKMYTVSFEYIGYYIQREIPF